MADYRLSIRVTADARRGLDRAVQASGVSLTALIEAWGRMFAEGTVALDEQQLALARQIERERRTRR